MHMMNCSVTRIAIVPPIKMEKKKTKIALTHPTTVTSSYRKILRNRKLKSTRKICKFSRAGSCAAVSDKTRPGETGSNQLLTETTLSWHRQVSCKEGKTASLLKGIRRTIIKMKKRLDFTRRWTSESFLMKVL